MRLRSEIYGDPRFHEARARELLDKVEKQRAMVPDERFNRTPIPELLAEAQVHATLAVYWRGTFS